MIRIVLFQTCFEWVCDSLIGTSVAYLIRSFNPNHIES